MIDQAMNDENKKDLPEQDTADLLDSIDIGGRLAKARRKRKLTINQVADQTKIRTENIAALEENRFDDLPEAVYVRSFLKVYGKFLELDTVEILADLKRLGVFPEENNLSLSTPVEEGALPSIKTMVAAFIVLLAVGGVWHNAQRISELTNPIFNEQPALVDVKPIIDELNPPTPAEAFLKPDNLEQEVTAQPVVAPADVEKSPVALIAKDVAEVKAPVVEKAAVVKKVDVVKEPVVKTVAVAEPPKEKGVRLYAEKDVWLHIYRKGNKKPIFAKTLKAGKSYVVSKNDLLVNVGLPPALIIYVDGEKLGVSGIADRKVHALKLEPAYLKDVYFAKKMNMAPNVAAAKTKIIKPKKTIEVKKVSAEIPSVEIKEEVVRIDKIVDPKEEVEGVNNDR